MTCMMVNIEVYSIAIPIVSTAAFVAVLLLVVLSGLKGIKAQAGVKRISEYVTLRCPICGYTTTREFRFGDYVGKVSNEDKCPNDGTSMVVISIGKEQQSQYT